MYSAGCLHFTQPQVVHHQELLLPLRRGAYRTSTLEYNDGLPDQVDTARFSSLTAPCCESTGRMKGMCSFWVSKSSEGIYKQRVETHPGRFQIGSLRASAEVQPDRLDD